MLYVFVNAGLMKRKVWLRTDVHIRDCLLDFRHMAASIPDFPCLVQLAAKFIF
jgi:hypothetical protein